MLTKLHRTKATHMNIMIKYITLQDITKEFMTFQATKNRIFAVLFTIKIKKRKQHRLKIAKQRFLRAISFNQSMEKTYKNQVYIRFEVRVKQNIVSIPRELSRKEELIPSMKNRPYDTKTGSVMSQLLYYIAKCVNVHYE